MVARSADIALVAEGERRVAQAGGFVRRTMGPAAESAVSLGSCVTVRKTGHLPADPLPLDPHPTPVPAPERTWFPPRRRVQTDVRLPVQHRTRLELDHQISCGVL